MKRITGVFCWQFAAMSVAIVAVLATLVWASDGGGEGPTGRLESLRGYYSVVWKCPHVEHAHRKSCEATIFLADQGGQPTELIIPEDVARGMPGRYGLFGKRVEVQGVRTLSGALEVRSISQIPEDLEDVEALLRDPSGALLGRSVAPPRDFSPEFDTQGVENKPFVTLLVRYSDVPGSLQPPTYYNNLFADTFPGLTHYFRRASFDQMRIDGSVVVGWLTLPRTRAEYLAGGTIDFATIVQDAVAAADPLVDFRQFYGINVCVNGDISTVGWWGFGGGLNLNVDGRNGFWGATVNGQPHDHFLITHEMGHAMGMPHSSGSYGAVYDSWWDVMSYGSWRNAALGFGLLATGLSSYQRLGGGQLFSDRTMDRWIPASRTFMAYPGTTQDVVLRRLDTPPQGSQFATILVPHMGNADQFYLVEYRRNNEYDTVRDANGGLPGQGVVIYFVDQNRSNPAHVMDATRNNNVNDDGAIWVPGETYSDTTSGVSFQILASNTETATVRVVVPASNPDPRRVTNTQDWGPGTLRNAMLFANVLGNVTVSFAIPTADPGFDGQQWVITVTSQLPYLVRSGIGIDGQSQTVFGGNRNPAGPEVAISGAGVSSWSTAFVIGANDNWIRSFSLRDHSAAGVWLHNFASGNTITGNHIGVNASGTVARGNADGIVVVGGSAGNLIEGNLISGNRGRGMWFSDLGTSGNIVTGNTIGLGTNGLAVPNAWHGMTVFSGAMGTYVTNNIVSGNGIHGIEAYGNQANFTTIEGNIVGLNAAGQVRGNANSGIVAAGGAMGTFIRTSSPGARQVASGNGVRGILVADSGTNETRVEGNFVGTTRDGMVARPNGGDGVSVVGSPKNTRITGNVSSGNTGAGVAVADPGTDDTVIQGNGLGTDATFIGSLPNGSHGIFVGNGAKRTIIGGVDPSQRNIVSGNTWFGVVIVGEGTDDTQLVGNYIGVDSSGTLDRGNGANGIRVENGPDRTIVRLNVASGNGWSGIGVHNANTVGTQILENFVGTDRTGELAIRNDDVGIWLGVGTTRAIVRDNVTSGNGQAGIHLQNAGTGFHVFTGNRVGVTPSGLPLGNEHGIRIIDGASDNTFQDNLIQYNRGNGVRLEGASLRNDFGTNFVYGNGRLGIDLVGRDGAFGVTPNDVVDPDSGPNDLTNFPTVTVLDATLSVPLIRVDLQAWPHRTYRVDVYATPEADPSGHGEGLYPVLTTTVATNGAGIGFAVGAAFRPDGATRYAAVATGPWGTSEFGPVTVIPSATLVQGIIEMEGFIPTPDTVPLTLEFIQNGVVVETRTNVRTAGSGILDLVTTRTGPHQIRVSGRTFLAKRTSILDFVPYQSVAFYLRLPNGDVDGSNAVDIDDFLRLAAAYESSPLTDPLTDLNGDGVCDIDDFLILAAAYETTGD